MNFAIFEPFPAYLYILDGDLNYYHHSKSWRRMESDIIYMSNGNEFFHDLHPMLF